MASSSASLRELNREYFNAHADTAFEQDWVQTLIQQITHYLRANIEWIGVTPGCPNAGTKMLDYACGTGAASMALAPYVSAIRGIDISEVMVEKYNTAASAQGLTEDQMHAVQGDLVAPLDEGNEDLKREDFYNFDVIVISMALHHVEDPQKMISKLVERLRDGGSLLVIDWSPSPGGDSHLHHHQHIHQHHQDHDDVQRQMKAVMQTMIRTSFGEDEMIAMLKDAGCSPVDYVLDPDISKLPAQFGGERRLFFAKGKKS